MRRYGMLQVLASLLLAVTAGAATAQTVTGSVGYRERIALPPGAVLEVALMDVSRADAAAVRMASQRFAMTGVPTDFTLAYDPALIEERMRYVIQATISLSDQVIYRSTTAHPVLSQGAGTHVDITVQRMPSPDATTLDNTNWVLRELQGSPVIGSALPTMEFGANGQVSVFAGCNRFAGKVEQQQEKFTFPKAMAGTMMACPEEQTVQERQVLDALPMITTMRQSDGELILMGTGGAVLMRLTPPA